MGNRGMALIVSYMVIMVLTIIGSSFLMRSISESRSAEYFSNSVRAFWVAEAGIQRAIFCFRDDNWQDDDWIDSPGNPSLKLLTKTKGDSGKYIVEVEGVGGDNIVITSTGYSPDNSTPGFAERTISVLYSRLSTPSMFSYAAFANAGVSLLGNSRTDSYDSRIGLYGGVNTGSSGDVATSSDSSDTLTLTGSSTVDGDAYTADGTASLGWSCDVTGQTYISEQPCYEQIDVPGGLSSLPSEEEISLQGNESRVLGSGNYVMPAISVKGNAQLVLDGVVNIYLTGASSLDISGSGRLVVNGSANIYIEGSAEVSGAATVNKDQPPSNLMLYAGQLSESIKIAGSGSIYGGIYAPDTDISINGNSRLYGAAVGDNISLSGSSKIHYGEAFSADNAGGSGSGDYIFQHWQEL